MKNFPNQASDLVRIRRTLQALIDLHDSGVNVYDDGALGYRLAQLGFYTFRGLDYDASDLAERLVDRIALEKAKPGSKQGARTNAREMRRTLSALGWIDGSGALTANGAEFLASTPGSQQERAALAEALWELEVTDQGGNSSHPVRVLLDLLAQGPSHNRAGLELALEAKTDSPQELARVRALYALDPSSRAAQLDARKPTIRNAVKILPSLARAAGFAVTDAHNVWTLSPDGAALVGDPRGGARRVVEQSVRARNRPKTRRQVDRDTAGKYPDQPPPASTTLTPEEQEQAKALLAQRTARHQQIVRRLASLINANGKMYEDPLSYDLLFVSEHPDKALLLVEVKTVASDAEIQCRLAAGQLSWYHYFNVSPEWPNRAVREIAVFDKELSSKLVSYLGSEDIAALLVEPDGDKRFEPLNDLAADLSTALGLG